MKPFDPKNRKGAYGDSPRRDRSGDSFNREDSRSSSHREDALSSFSKDKRPRISRPTKPHGASSDNPYDRRGDEQRRSFNPNFTKDNRLKSGSRDRDDRPYGKPKYGANRDDRYNRENRGDRFDKDDRYRKNDRFEREDRPQRDGNRYNKDDRFNRNDRPDRFDKDDRYRKNDRPEREDRPWRKDDRPSGPYKPQRRDESQPYGERPRFQKDGDRKGGFGKKWDRSDSSRGARTHDSRFKKDRKEDYPRYDAPKPQGAIRLNRFIANSGICSRREADDLITAGVVAVNGKIVTELGTKVNPEDEVRFNGEIVKGEKKVYILMNKPKGFVTSVEDPHSDKTVMDLIKGACTERVYPVGRLDKNSVGVLLFTNDGDLTRKLTHPSYNKQKIYQVTLDKPLSEEDMTKIAEGNYPRRRAHLRRRGQLCQRKPERGRNRNPFGQKQDRSAYFRIARLFGAKARSSLFRRPDQKTAQTRRLAVPEPAGSQYAKERRIRINGAEDKDRGRDCNPGPVLFTLSGDEESATAIIEAYGQQRPVPPFGSPLRLPVETASRFLSRRNRIRFYRQSVA